MWHTYQIVVVHLTQDFEFLRHVALHLFDGHRQACKTTSYTDPWMLFASLTSFVADWPIFYWPSVQGSQNLHRWFLSLQTEAWLKPNAFTLRLSRLRLRAKINEITSESPRQGSWAAFAKYVGRQRWSNQPSGSDQPCTRSFKVRIRNPQSTQDIQQLNNFTIFEQIQMFPRPWENHHHQTLHGQTSSVCECVRLNEVSNRCGGRVRQLTKTVHRAKQDPWWENCVGDLRDVLYKALSQAIIG